MNVFFPRETIKLTDNAVLRDNLLVSSGFLGFRLRLNVFGNIAGSRNVQPKQFGPTHKLVASAKQQPVVLVDRTGAASVAAAKALKKAGFEKIHVLDGGLPAWTAADLPLVKGRN